MKSIGIMQPYFLPYIGYFQLINAVDVFVIYDNIQYSKKGWINRNRILVNGKDEYISLPLTKSSDYHHVVQKELSNDFDIQALKLLRKIEGSYKKAPNFKEVFPIIESILNFENRNLFTFIFNSISKINDFLNITTQLVISSEINIDHTLKSQEKVMSIVKAVNGDTYINPIGGIDLYDRENFKVQGIDLFFLKTNNIVYKQFQNDFIPFLSILDVMMFNGKEEIIRSLKMYEKI